MRRLWTNLLTCCGPLRTPQPFHSARLFFRNDSTDLEVLAEMISKGCERGIEVRVRLTLLLDVFHGVHGG